MTKPPKWFIPVCALALIWNLVGLAAVVADARLTASDIAALPEAQRAMYAARPGWSIVASFVAVVCGTLGSVALLLRHRVATGLFVASLAGLALQDFALFVIVNRSVPLGTVPLVLQGIVLVIAIGLIFLARKAVASGWLRQAAV